LLHFVTVYCDFVLKKSTIFEWIFKIFVPRGISMEVLKISFQISGKNRRLSAQPMHDTSFCICEDGCDIDIAQGQGQLQID
jgi:hypothetical protein